MNSRGLRFYLENYMSQKLIKKEFDLQMETVGECTCNSILGNIFPKCKFKITRKQHNKGFNSSDLWDHLHTHIRKCEKDEKHWTNDEDFSKEYFWNFMNNRTPGEGSPSGPHPYNLYMLNGCDHVLTASESYWKTWLGFFGEHYDNSDYKKEKIEMEIKQLEKKLRGLDNGNQ